MVLSINDLAQALNLKSAQVQKLIKKVTGQKLESLTVVPSVARAVLESQGYMFNPQIVSIQMLKGGVAKTTSALNLGLRAAMYGARVLFVDLDQQANLSFALGFQKEDAPVWVDILEKKVTPFQCIQPIEAGLDLIPSNLNNSILDRILLNSNRNWALSVKNPLNSISANYDLIIIDTAPALSAINTAVSVASDLILMPMAPDRFSWLGLKKHRQELEDIKQEFQAHFQTKILFTRFDGREKTSHDILQQCIDLFADEMMSGYIRTSSEVKNTLGTKKSIFQTSNPVKDDYDLVTRELLGFSH